MADEKEDREESTGASIEDIDLDSIKVAGRDEDTFDDSSAGDDSQEGEESASSSADDKEDGGEAQASGDDSDKTEDGDRDSGADEQKAEKQASFFSSLPGDLGLEIKSDEDVVNSLREYAKIKSQSPASDTDGLSETLKAAIQIEKSGGDAETFLRLISVDPEKIDAKEALWMKFQKDKQDIVAKNPAFARKTFEREFQAKYGILSKDFADEVEREENAEEIAYAKDALDFESQEAKAALKKERDAFFQAVKTSQTKTQETSNGGGGDAKSPEDAAKYQKEYGEAVSKSLKDYKGFKLSLSDTESLQVGFDESEIKTIEGYMKAPLKFLQEIGFDKDAVDPNKLRDAVAAHVAKGKIGKMVLEHATGLAEKKIVEQKVVRPSSKQSSARDVGKKDPLEEIAEAFEAKRNY